MFYGPDINAGEFIGGALFVPVNSTLGEVGFEIIWGEPGVRKVYIMPEIGKGTYISGYSTLDLHEVGIYAGGTVGRVKIAGQTISIDTGVILSFDPSRLSNYLNPDYWNLKPIGDCGGHGSDDHGGDDHGSDDHGGDDHGGDDHGGDDEVGHGECVACVEGGGGKACAARCTGNECVACVEGGGGKACAATCEDAGNSKCVACVEGAAGRPALPSARTASAWRAWRGAAGRPAPPSASERRRASAGRAVARRVGLDEAAAIATATATDGAAGEVSARWGLGGRLALKSFEVGIWGRG